MLSETQILILNNLIYLSQFTNPLFNKYQTVGDILKNINPEDCAGIVTMSAEEWKDIIDMALADTEICELKVTNRYYENETGAGMACFVDKNGQAYAVFAGTGANEWRDDCVAGAQQDSVQQLKALEWFEGLPYDNIVVSGHSKGGNKAMYVFIVSDNVKECYAFDGEGFSMEFCDKYSEEIAQKQNKIHLRANYRDFVNILLVNIAGDTEYVVNDYGVTDASQYHAPNSLFKYDDGNITYSIGGFGSQDPAMEMFHEFTVYMLENAADSEKIIAFSVLGELLTKYMGGSNGVTREEIIEIYGLEAGEIILRYLTKYLQDLCITDYGKYYKYRKALGGYIGDAYDSWWYFIIGNLIAEPLGKTLVFDNIANGRILRLYKMNMMFQGGDVRGREFTEAVKNTLINAAKETEEEAWWQVSRWDCWYKVEQFFGHLNMDCYTADVDSYYRKLVDINDASAKEIEKIFNKVYELDNSYSAKMNGYAARLNTNVLSRLKTINQSIVPH